TEHVHHVDRVVADRVREGGIAALAQECRVPGVHGDDAVPGVSKIAGHDVARPQRLRRQADHRNRVRFAEQRPERLRAHASGRWTCGAPLTARPTRMIPERRAIVSASVEGTLGVATQESPARAALYASSAEMRPVTSSPRPTIGWRAMTAAPTTLSTALWRPMSSAWNRSRSPSVSAAAWIPPVSL